MTNPYSYVSGMPGTVTAPRDPIKDFEESKYSWDAKTVSPQTMMAQNFSLQKQNALQNVYAGAQSGNATAMSSLAATGGLSAADRQALMAQGQRQRVSLSQGATAPIEQMQAQNLYDTQKFNIGQAQDAADLNQQILNQRAKDIAVENERKAVNIYQQRLQEAMLERQIDAARKIAQAQGA